MSNVLQFRSFHKRHFSPEQVKYWQQQVLNQQQPNTSSQWQQYSNTVYDSRHPHYDYDYTNYPSEGLENKSETDVDMTEAEREEFDEEEGQQQQTTLSQEAIEIFKFSEAYRKEREELEDKVEEEEEHDKWITDAYRNGIEAPVTCLVYHNNNSDDHNDATRTAATSSSSEHVRIQEHLLNSAYLDACREGQAVLWPVLPLRL